MQTIYFGPTKTFVESDQNKIIHVISGYDCTTITGIYDVDNSSMTCLSGLLEDGNLDTLTKETTFNAGELIFLVYKLISAYKQKIHEIHGVFIEISEIPQSSTKSKEFVDDMCTITVTNI